MSFFLDPAAKALLAQDHPMVDPARCHNKRQMRSRCTACQDICPQALYQKPGFVPRFNACVNCGLCVSACTTRCISPAPDTLEAQAALLKKPEGPVWLGCDAAARQNDLSVHCLAALPWEYLAALSLRGPVILDIAPCAQCEQDAAAALLRQNLEKLLIFWGAEEFGRRIQLDDSGAPVPEHGATTRRGLLRSALAQGQKGLGKLAGQLPGSKQQPSEGLVYRGLLHQQMLAHPGAHGWILPRFTEKCWGCGICEAICPQKALQFTPQPDGKVAVQLFPSRCTGCELCAQLCPDKAISGTAIAQLPDLNTVCLAVTEQAQCRHCGHPIRPGSNPDLCPACRKKQARVPGRRL